VNEKVMDKACDTVKNLAVCDVVKKNDAFTSIEQKFQGDIGVSDSNTSSDEELNAENQMKDVQYEQELPGQCTHNNEIVNSVGKAFAGNDDPSKDPDHSINAENTTVDEPDHTLDSVEVNTVGEANDSNGHPSQVSEFTVNVENSNVDEPDIIHDSFRTIDTNAEQTESMVDDPVEHNDVSRKELPIQCAHDNEEVNTVDKVNDVNGDPGKDSDHTIDAENMTVDEPDRMPDCVEVNTMSEANDVNSLTAIDGHDRQYFNGLRSTVVSRRIFIRLQSLIAC
jgi:hypothetical protein